jgi:protein-S-isoprenylcysteine O-methyltransferase Ste14
MKLSAYTVMALAVVLGSGSILALTVFLWIGPFGWVDLDLEPGTVLAWDAMLAVAFCLQHSIMIRRGFRRRLERFIAPYWHGALFTIFSGIFLFAMVLLWQESPVLLLTIEGPWRWLARTLFAAAFLATFWASRSLGSFDSLGIRPILHRLRGTEPRQGPIAIRGPYRWMRHPIYFFTLVMMGSYPDLTADRLMFDLVWTAWIVVGSILEERDLVQEFGEDYRRYQVEVPMLVPWRLPRS